MKFNAHFATKEEILELFDEVERDEFFTGYSVNKLPKTNRGPRTNDDLRKLQEKAERWRRGIQPVNKPVQRRIRYQKKSTVEVKVMRQEQPKWNPGKLECNFVCNCGQKFYSATNLALHKRAKGCS